MKAYIGRRLEAIDIVNSIAALTMTDAKSIMRGGRLTPAMRGIRDAAMHALKEECFFKDANLAKWFKVSRSTVKTSLGRGRSDTTRGYATRRLAHMGIGYLRGRLDEQEDTLRAVMKPSKKGGR